MRNVESVSVIGSGTWGCALASQLSNGNRKVFLCSLVESDYVNLSLTRINKNLPFLKIPSSVVITNDVQLACSSEIIIIAVPSVFFRGTLVVLENHIRDDQIIAIATKGIEESTLYTMSDVVHCLFPKNSVVVLSGPTHAEEVAKGMPTAIIASCENEQIANKVGSLFSGSCIRAYTNPDVRGVELCGALKNVVALMCGVACGAGYGDNLKAAMMTRGMNEIARLGKAMGCSERTFFGLAGIGDLIVTATSAFSRNNRCGQLIGQGISVDEAVKKVGMVVEGLNAIKPAMQLAERYKINMSILFAANDVVFLKKKPLDTLSKLMLRPVMSELDKIRMGTIHENYTFRNDGGSGMKRVITYGTFDLLHYGHINLLKRAKALGDYLIVCISTDEFNLNEKHKKTYFTFEQRKALLESLRYVDLVIPEENWQQKRSDMHEYHVDVFVMGDDWRGKFDFLREEGVEVVYLPRTPEISSSKIKKDLYDANAVDSESKMSHEDIETDPS